MQKGHLSRREKKKPKTYNFKYSQWAESRKDGFAEKLLNILPKENKSQYAINCHKNVSEKKKNKDA